MIPVRQNISASSLIRRATIFFVIVFLFCSSLSAQSKSLSVKGEGNYREELYIQTDRDIYIAGEEVYLKVSEFGALTHTIGSISRVVYVDMPDRLGTPVIQLKIATDGRTGSGAFKDSRHPEDRVLFYPLIHKLDEELSSVIFCI